MKFALRHSTKGFFQYPNNWITDPANARDWATRFRTVEQAREVAASLKSLSGKSLKLDIVVINAPKTQYKFESYRLIEQV